MFILNSKHETLNILSNYFKKFDIKELGYYLERYQGGSIPNFLESNIYEPKDIELLNLLIDHLKIVINKVFHNTTPFNLKRFPIKLSFKTSSIHWEELFVIGDTIFISYQYLIKVFEKIEYNNYNSVNDIFFEGDKIYDLELLKKLGESMYYIIQYTNLDYWEEDICEKYNCSFVDKSLINFKNPYIILKEPNTSFLDDAITIYRLHSGEIYAIINSIYSNISFSPYWEKKIIKLNYSNGQYTEISNDIVQFTDNNIDDINCSKNNMHKFNYHSNPFVSKAKQITECIIHNQSFVSKTS